ncbi:hypothetical protein D3C86_1819640 [compost metagenome]
MAAPVYHAEGAADKGLGWTLGAIVHGMCGVSHHVCRRVRIADLASGHMADNATGHGISDGFDGTLVWRREHVGP